MKKVAIGIDIGGTKTAFGVVDLDGNVLYKDFIATPKRGDVSLFIDLLVNGIKQMETYLHDNHHDYEILGIGIGAPNANYFRGTIEYAPNLAFKGVIPIKKMLEDKLPEFKTIVLTKDSNAAAIGEMMFGGAQNMKTFAMFTLGTGVGSGLVVNGKIVYGHDGFAGECGHSTLFPNGRKCGCGGLGHLEAYCSASGMKRTAFELLARDNSTTSLLSEKSFNELNSKLIFEAAEKGDPIALEVFELTGNWLGMALADTVNHMSPEAIFLFGGPTAAGDFIFTPTRKSLEAHLLPVFKGKVKLLPSMLKAGDAAIVGASALVYQEFN